MSKRWLRRLALLAALVLTACGPSVWTQDGHGPEHRGHNSRETTLTRDNVASLEQVWSVRLDGAVSEPMVTEDQIYVSYAGAFWSGTFPKAAVRAIDPADGSTTWETNLNSLGGRFNYTTNPLAVVGDQLWASWSARSQLSPPACLSATHRLNLADGSLLSTWDHHYSTSSTASADVVARVGTTELDCDGATKLFVHSAETGRTLWTATLSNLTGRTPAPTIANGYIYVTLDNTLFAFPESGCGASTCSPSWTVDAGADIGNVTPVAGPDGQLFVASFAEDERNIVALDGSDGSELWRVPVEVGGTMAMTDDWLYVGTATDLHVLPASGCAGSVCEPTWSAHLADEVEHHLALAGGVVYVSDGGNVKAFDAAGCGSATCSPLASVSVGGTVSGLSVAQGRLYVASSSGQLAGFEPA